VFGVEYNLADLLTDEGPGDFARSIGPVRGALDYLLCQIDVLIDRQYIGADVRDRRKEHPNLFLVLKDRRHLFR